MSLTGASHTRLRRTLGGKLRDWFADLWYSPVARVVCCVDADAHEGFELRRRQDAAVTRHMLMSLQHYGTNTSIIEEVLEDIRCDGIDLSRVPPPPPAAPLVGSGGPNVRPRSLMITDGTISSSPPTSPSVPNPTAPPRRNYTEARFVPRFVASVVVALRSRLGALKPTEANKLVVEREAIRLMRLYNVRETDCASHLPAVLRNYFLNDVHYRVATSASRMTRFERWLHGATRPQPSFEPLL